MAIRTLRQHLFIYDHGLVSDHARLYVAFVTSHVRVSSLQREMRPRVVIEGRRNPALRVVAIRATSLPRLRELAHVRVFVTIFANLRRAFELHFFRACGNFVTIAALHRAMRAKQRELCFRVVKTVYVRPRPRVMTSLAAERRAIGSPLGHSVVELAVMDILVAANARHVFEDKRQDFVCTPCSSCFMAIGARHRCVRPGQCETSVAMFGNRKSGSMKIQNGMTILAFVLIWGGSKLAVMRVFVAVGARCELYLVNRVFACR